MSEKLFSKDGDVLKPSEAPNLLKLLDEECKILQQSLIAHEKSANIVDYLKYQKDVLFSLCKNFLLTKLKDDIKGLPEGTEGFIELLKQSMIESDKNDEVRASLFLIPDVPLLTRGILSFLEKTSESLTAKALDKAEGGAFFRTRYESSIIKPCNIIEKQIQSSITEFSTLSHDKHMLEQFDPFVKLWLENSNVGMSIVGRGQTFSIGLGRQSYKLLLDDKNKKSPTKKRGSAWNNLRSWFGN